MGVRERVRQDRFGSTAQEAVVGVLVVAAHIRAALGEVCAGHGITHDQYNVLRILRGSRPDGLPRYEIADRLVDRAPDVTRLLDRLERQGLVERFRSDEDRRLSLSRITRAGLALLDRMDPDIEAVSERFARPLTETRRRQLIRTCDAMLVP